MFVIESYDRLFIGACTNTKGKSRQVSLSDTSDILLMFKFRLI